jgi:predicted nucleotidyltransferase
LGGLVRYYPQVTKEMASKSAREVALYLKRTHGATRVLLFGSTINGDFQADHSDIDLYFEGIPCDRELAVGGMTLCAFPELEMDLFPAAMRLNISPLRLGA